ncbi:hypothetical protein MVEN_00802700 [Mycena venus]|uniref:Zn(2)-C6 fungal-type domain-containing protein n=1 Tax=Mycena venus TaxID=2733690 RepID=A0A8H6YGD1_9AGAR|nr:hypothetical protein MVEN_00802700 [Mycena venus]
MIWSWGLIVAIFNLLPTHDPGARCSRPGWFICRPFKFLQAHLRQLDLRTFSVKPMTGVMASLAQIRPIHAYSSPSTSSSPPLSFGIPPQVLLLPAALDSDTIASSNAAATLSAPHSSLAHEVNLSAQPQLKFARAKVGEPTKKQPLSCFFCRKRKIACVRTEGSSDLSCTQCIRRNLECQYPTVSRRGQRAQSAARKRLEHPSDSASPIHDPDEEAVSP